MQRKPASTARKHAALAAFVRNHLGVEHRDDVGPWLGQAAWLDETYNNAERSSRRKVVSLLGDLSGLVRRPPRQAAKHARHKRVVR
jgi:hypothetical protein